MVVALAKAPAAEETASWVWAPPDALAHAAVGGGDEAHPARFHSADQGSEHQVDVHRADAAACIEKVGTATVFEKRSHPPNIHGG